MDFKSVLRHADCYFSEVPVTSLLVPEIIDGKTHTATVVELNPWVEYEFRVVASNKIGGGEPSLPSEKVRTEEAG